MKKYIYGILIAIVVLAGTFAIVNALKTWNLTSGSASERVDRFFHVKLTNHFQALNEDMNLSSTEYTGSYALTVKMDDAAAFEKEVASKYDRLLKTNKKLPESEYQIISEYVTVDQTELGNVYKGNIEIERSLFTWKEKGKAAVYICFSTNSENQQVVYFIYSED